MYAYNLACVYSRAIEMINKDPKLPAATNAWPPVAKGPPNSSKRPSSTAGGTRPG
ncbi:MAG: hypothetical protein Ct9H300mP1_26380 [Planctomycetaceae bacterium]|nr:MAG: hypothetical protein Ct9H300mP1_26380 [Planctomycetaceae bacterium]